MRTGLVAVGVAFLVVGGVALGSLYLSPPESVRVEHDSSTTVEVNPSIWTTTADLWGENGSAMTFTIHWASTVPVEIDLFSKSSSCTPGTSCAIEVATWGDGDAGTWTANATPHYPYELQALAKSAGDGLLYVSAAGAAQMTLTPNTVQTVASTIAAIAALVVGGVALFLGLFLRADPYGPPPPVIPLRAEDIEELYGPGSEDDEDGPASGRRPPA